MQIPIAIAVVMSLALGAQARGVVSKVTAGRPDATGTIQFTVEGRNPCGAVHIDYGDGNAVTHPIERLPVTIPHEYAQTGEYLIHAKGMGNCDEGVSAKVRVDRVRRPAQPEPQPKDWTPEQFRLLDYNRDNFISRSEWFAEDSEFVRVDRSGDERLSRDEFLDGDPDRRATGRGRGAGDRRGTTATTFVDSREEWTDTGLDVRAGDALIIDASGMIQFMDQGPPTGPNGAAGQRASDGAPMPSALVGALVARVGNSAPFLVGARSDGLRAPRNGPLYLRVNDGLLDDNRGSFRVRVSVTRGRDR